MTLWSVKDGLPRRNHCATAVQWLTRAQVPREPWKRTARDLQPQPMATLETIGRGRQLDPHALGPAAGLDALDAVAHVERPPTRLDIAQPHEEISARGA